MDSCVVKNSFIVCALRFYCASKVTLLGDARIPMTGAAIFAVRVVCVGTQHLRQPNGDSLGSMQKQYVLGTLDVPVLISSERGSHRVGSGNDGFHRHKADTELFADKSIVEDPVASIVQLMRVY